MTLEFQNNFAKEGSLLDRLREIKPGDPYFEIIENFGKLVAEQKRIINLVLEKFKGSNNFDFYQIFLDMYSVAIQDHYYDVIRLGFEKKFTKDVLDSFTEEELSIKKYIEEAVLNTAIDRTLMTQRRKNTEESPSEEEFQSFDTCRAGLLENSTSFEEQIVSFSQNHKTLWKEFFLINRKISENQLEFDMSRMF